MAGDSLMPSSTASSAVMHQLGVSFSYRAAHCLQAPCRKIRVAHLSLGYRSVLWGESVANDRKTEASAGRWMNGWGMERWSTVAVYEAVEMSVR